MITPLIVVLVLIVLGVLVAWTPLCECGHRGGWHDPSSVEGGGRGCFKCDCKEFKRR